MKYKMLWIIGSEKNYKHRVYMVSNIEFNQLEEFNTFVLRETIGGERVYRSCETNKYYMIENEGV